MYLQHIKGEFWCRHQVGVQWLPNLPIFLLLHYVKSRFSSTNNFKKAKKYHYYRHWGRKSYKKQTNLQKRWIESDKKQKSYSSFKKCVFSYFVGTVKMGVANVSKTAKVAPIWDFMQTFFWSWGMYLQHIKGEFWCHQHFGIPGLPNFPNLKFVHHN